MNQIIRPAQLAKRLCLSRATLWRMEKRGELPPKIALSPGVTGWRESDISEWLEARQILQADTKSSEAQNERMK